MENNRIKELRKIRNITLRELSADTGLDWSTISAIENGRRKLNMRFAEILSDYFHVSVDYLLGRCSNPHSTREAEDLKSDLIKCVLLLEVDGQNTKKQVRENLNAIIVKYFKEEN